MRLSKLNSRIGIGVKGHELTPREHYVWRGIVGVHRNDGVPQSRRYSYIVIPNTLQNHKTCTLSKTQFD